MSESGLRTHLALDCSNPGVHVDTLLEMLAGQRARAEAAEAENAALRAAAQYVAVSCLHVEGWCKGCDAVRDILSRPVGERAPAALDGAGAGE